MIKHSANARTQHFELAARFEKIRDLLLTDRYATRLKNPLAYWALPADRRLPRALMHRVLGDLLRTSFDSLAATPGIGQKKMHSLLRLLDRALHSDELEQERLDDSARDAVNDWTAAPTGGLPVHGDPANISEVTWAKWRAVVVERGLGHEPLGRFAKNLHDLPRVIWNTTLATYAGLTLAEIRKLKTHGEKRVRCVVKIFGQLHAHLTESAGSLLDVTPQTVEDVEAWLRTMHAAAELPTADAIRTGFLRPLVEQIRIDAGEATANLVLGRLGWDGQKLSVRRAAMKLRLTRARIYQLLEDAATVIGVRWPKGLVQMRSLLERFSFMPSDSAERRLLDAAAEAFFPNEYRPQITPPPAFLRRFEPKPAATAWPTTAAPLRPATVPIASLSIR